MVRATRWQAAAGTALVLACACNARSLVPPSADGGRDSPPPTPTDAAGQGVATGGRSAIAAGDGPGTGGAPAAAGGSIGPGATGAGGAAADAGSALCPPVDEVGPAPTVRVPAPPPPSSAGVSCRGLSPTFIFPPPGPDVTGAFTRCASFDVGGARSVAVSPDGRFVALVTDDGIARLISVEQQQLVAVLASPRAMIDLVAYEPHGRGVLTLARAQREVTLWRASDWTPVWRVTLPGLPYYHASGGGLAFAPDGQSAVVSPGSDTFVLDVATGAVRARRSNSWDAVLDVSYGWGGQRIIVAEPSLAAHCQHDPNGGTVTVLDATTLAPVATVADLGSYGNPGGWRGVPAFRASPVDDLVLVAPGIDDPPALRAFRLSDGGALPPPAFTAMAMPLAFMPDGGSVLVTDGGALQRVRVADGAIASVTMLGAAGPLGMSSDGGVVAFGGSGAALLRVLDGPDGIPATICDTDDPTGNTSGPAGSSSPSPSGPGTTSALSFDGQLLAVAAHGEVRVLRRADGALVRRIPDGLSADYEPVRVTLSPLGRFVVTQSQARGGVFSVFPVSEGSRVGAFAPDGYGWSWVGMAFSQREDRAYSNGYRDGVYRLDALELGAGKSSFTPIPNFTVVIGTSDGCPVLYESARGAWRACGTCEDAPIGGAEPSNPVGAQGAVLASDGKYIGTWSNVHDPGVKVWKLPPTPTRVASLTPRGGWNGWDPVEFAVAISPGATRVLTGAAPAGSCYFGPQFPIEVHDVATNTVVDMLPPAPAAADGAVRTVAYGAQLWCAR
jgi:hypothetical protein